MRHLFIVFLILSNYLGFCQENIIPPSPEASSIIQYEMYPVDYSTGVAKVEIPLYVVQSTKLTLPISLKYHASGIKVNDVSSVVGLGWSLDAGGVLTRTIKDQQDISDKINNSHSIAELNALTLDQQLDYLKNENGFYDKESDYYTYSTASIGGSFIAGDTVDTYVQIPKQDRKIVHFDNDDFGGYRIYSEEGIIYEFETYETTNNSITGFYLTKLISSDHSDTIRFEYDILSQVLDQYGYTSTLNVLGQIDNCTGTGRPYGSGLSYNWVENYRDIPLLTNIKFAGGEVEFIYSHDRIDKREYRLSSIHINDLNGTLVKSISLYTSYFLSESNPTPDPDFKKNINFRLRLDSLSILGSANQSFNTYKFGYNEDHRLPPYCKNSDENFYGSGLRFFGQDLWGYFNGVQNNKTLFPEMPVNSVFDPYRQYIANRDVDIDYARTAILNKIIYPTGGMTIFAYGTNKGNSGNDIGGLRIDKMSMISNYGDTIEHSFEYTGPHHALDEFRIKDENNYFFETGYTCTNGLTFYENLSSNTTLPILLSGNPIFYEQVTEYLGDVNNNSGKTIRKYRYTSDELYSGQNCIGYIGCGATRLKPKYNLLNSDKSWQRGQLIDLKNYKNTSSGYDLVQSEEYYYKVYDEDEWLTGLQSYNSIINSGTGQNTYSYYIYNNKVNTGIIKLDSLVNKVVVDGQENYSYKKYHYNAINRLSRPHQNVTSIDMNKSNGDMTTVKYYYSKDLDQPVGIVSLLRENNLVSIPLETRYLEDNHRIYDAEKIEYNNNLQPSEFFKFFTESPKDSSDLQYTHIKSVGYNSGGKTNSIVKDFNIPVSYIWGYHNMYPIASADNAFPNQIYYTSFENDSINITTSLAKTGIKSWNGDYTIPTENRPIQGDYIIEYWENLDNITWIKKSYIINNGIPTTINSMGIIDELRVYPLNAFFKSFTYKPLIGMTSSTNENGISQFYQYDQASRLMKIIDEDGNIISQFDYHYINP